jgi:hypothetical protein
MKIQIIQEDIDNGTKGSPYNCGIARALKRIFDNADLDVNVFYTSLSLNGVAYKMTEEATNFVWLFDSKDVVVKPTEIEIPELVLA